ncbi:hypothetical protein [Clostridium sp. SM-530-WT-3G]|uniref:hypothetical protein n=1 Tax=Clostridium sp. SM-530-WT-3G TaxID=2725303 RepID=UPI00145E1D50|nr:hypothetical protein [Clostridium sp. SM-530-WT-3G]NME82950.1 hypothetical protein [Clostridium sp. SM-530-WT-3G]
MKSIKKRYILRKVIPSIFLFIAACAGLIKINIINTRALSPIGNGKENYEIVSEEFGEDFSKFIKDNSVLKIYCNKGEDILVRIKENDFKIKSKLSFIDDFKNKIDELVNQVKNI